MVSLPDLFPDKEGLKLGTCTVKLDKDQLPDLFPDKEGLKRGGFRFYVPSLTLPDLFPDKEGLKHLYSFFQFKEHLTSRPVS